MAGSVSHLLYARIDMRRFYTVYTAKGRWGLLDGLLWIPHGCEPLLGLAGMPVRVVAAGNSGSSKGRSVAQVGLHQVSQAIKEAATDILGMDFDGELQIQCSCDSTAGMYFRGI